MTSDDSTILRPVSERYGELVASGAIEHDPAQAELAARLDTLNEQLAADGLASKHSSLGWIFSKRAPKPRSIRGLYVWGAVGRGKTMLMDLFFSVSAVRAKRRAHFHAFMADIQDRLHQARKAILAGSLKGDDPIVHVSAAIAAETRLLCFDEFSVTDIADAMILGRLFARLFELGTVVVATSNVAPDRLYRDGLNRALFLPFIDLLKANVDVVELTARTDFRMEKTDLGQVYWSPLGPAADQAIERIWLKLSHGRPGAPAEIAFRGRQIPVPLAVDGLARFTFADLCETPLAAADYLKIAGRFHTVVIESVPVMEPAMRNVVKRFINLIDAFYDSGTRLIVSAAAEPSALYRGGDGSEAFEFERTVSRLVEMRSSQYIAAPQNLAGSAAEIPAYP